jgi:IclR family KDG regulon transcriptional repressor
VRTVESGNGGTAPAVVLAVRVLEELASRGGAVTLDDLTVAVDEPRSSVHRILNTLLQESFVQRVGARSGYRLAPRVMILGAAYLRELDLTEQFRSAATPIVLEINETMQLAVLDWPDAVFIAHVDSRRLVRLVTEIGRRVPAHASAVGKALLAFSSMNLVERYGELELQPVTKYTITELQALQAELIKTRRRGWARTFRESDESLCCLAAPIYRSPGDPVAAISICVPEPVMSKEKEAFLAGRLVAGAKTLSSRLEDQFCARL